MSTYALIENNIVTNIIEWAGPKVDPIAWPEGTTAIIFDQSLTDVQIGYVYDPLTGLFSPPTS